MQTADHVDLERQIWSALQRCVCLCRSPTFWSQSSTPWNSAKRIHYHTAYKSFRQLQKSHTLHTICKPSSFELILEYGFINRFFRSTIWYMQSIFCSVTSLQLRNKFPWYVMFCWNRLKINKRVKNLRKIDAFTWSLFPVKNDSLKFVTTSKPTIPSSPSRRLFISVVYRITFLALATSNSPEIVYMQWTKLNILSHAKWMRWRNKLSSLPSETQCTRHIWTWMWSGICIRNVSKWKYTETNTKNGSTVAWMTNLWAALASSCLAVCRSRQKSVNVM